MVYLKLTTGPISFLLLVCLAVSSAGLSASEKITIRRADQPREVDIWTYRDRLAEQHKLEEAMRHYRTRQWLWTLPVGCLAYHQHYFRCGADYYRPYRYRGGEVYVQVPQDMLNKPLAPK